MSEENKNLNNEPAEAPVEKNEEAKKPLDKKNIIIIAAAAVVVVVAIVLAVVFGGGQPSDNNGGQGGATLNDYKLGLGVVVNLGSSKDGLAQNDTTVAAVVLDKDGKIVSCRIDVAQNKVTLNADGTLSIPESFKTKMELGDDYGMAGKVDNNGDGVMKEWYDQTKAFETYVVGMTASEVKAIETELVNGHYIAKDTALLEAGCTIQITDFIEAVAKACEDKHSVSFQANEFKLGVGINSYNDGSKAATAATEDAEAISGSVQVYCDIAASVVVDGKIVASLNDAIQPKIAFDAEGKLGEKTFKGTKRELEGGYGMAGKVDNNGDGIMLEWFEQSAAFSAHVTGKTVADIKALGAAENLQEKNGHMITKDEALLNAGCTIQISGIVDVVVEAANNAR